MRSLQPTQGSQNTANLQNAALVLTILGCVTGVAMGFAGGLAGRSPWRGVIIGLGALAVGGLVSALSSWALLPLFYRRIVPDPNDLLSPILIHGGIWMAIGAVGGLAFAIGMGCRRCLATAIGGACLGAILATVLFHLIGAGLFSDSGSTEPIASQALVRLLAMLLVTVLVAIGAARGAEGHIAVPAAPVSQL